MSMPFLMIGQVGSNQMAQPETLIAPLSMREVAFEQFEEFFESILEQSQLTTEQQTALGEQLRASIEKRDKLGNCLQWLKDQAELLRAKERQLAERRGRFEKLFHTLTSSLHQQMLDLGIRKVEGLEYSFTVKKNPPHVEIFDEEKIPPQFISYKPVIDKAAIKSALEEGKEVPGAKLVQATHIDVR
jgi:Siphovirus Gp157